MTAAWWGAITGTLSLALLLAREWLTFFPIVRVRWMAGYEAENRPVGAVEAPRLVGAWCSIRVKNWSARPIEVVIRGARFETNEEVLFQAEDLEHMTVTIGPWATHTFRAPLVDVLGVPGADAEAGTVTPFVTTSEGKIFRGPRAMLVGSEDPRFEREDLLSGVAVLLERSDANTHQLGPRIFAVTESFVLRGEDASPAQLDPPDVHASTTKQSESA